jgi:hypothetical protein
VSGIVGQDVHASSDIGRSQIEQARFRRLRRQALAVTEVPDTPAANTRLVIVGEDASESHFRRETVEKLDGYTTIELAERDYGVVIDPGTLSVDQEATTRLRKDGLRCRWPRHAYRPGARERRPGS